MNIPLLERLHLYNPVLSKDIRTRMRGTKAFLVQGVYVAILVLMTGIAYFAWWQGHRAGMAAPNVISSEVGRLFYMLIFMTQTALIVLITPALTAGTVAIEREQRTYELLACTRLRPAGILLGKLLSGWLFVVMLLTCSLPLAALCLMFGGVSSGEIASSYLMLCLFALMFGSIGILCSAHFAKSVTAIMVSYGITFAFLITTISLDPMTVGIGRALNPFGFVAQSTDPISLFRTYVPPWLPGLVILPLTSLLLINWAMTRLPHFVVNRALAVRGLMALLLIAVTLLGMGSAGTPYYPDRVFMVVMPGAIALFLCAAFLATGETPPRRPRSLLLWVTSGIDPRKMFSGLLSGGWSYLLLLTAVFTGSLWVAGKLGTPGTAPMPWGGGGVPATSLKVGTAAGWHLFLLLGAVLLCYSALGLVGAALKSRRAGVVLILSLFAITHLVIGIMWMQDITSRGRAGVGSDSIGLYLAPYIGIVGLFIPNELTHVIAAGMRPPLAPPFWQVTAAVYLVAAALFFLLAELVHHANGRMIRAPQPELQPAAQTGD